MPRIKRDAKTLKGKAISSLRYGLEAFNSFRDDGRQTATLLHMQHACEMLLKASLIHKNQSIFDKNKGTSIGFEKCVNLSKVREVCNLSDSETGTLRTVDSLRDAEQHWHIVVEESFLFLHLRAMVTILDRILDTVFAEKLADYIPARVLPISTQPLQSFDILVDREFNQIRELLQPNRRQRDEARGRIRTLLAMEAHSAEKVDVSERDIDRVERAIRAGSVWQDTFPRLVSLIATVEGEGPQILVRFTKNEGAAPIRFVDGDDPANAAAIREIDLQNKYRYSPTELAEKLKITTAKSKLLRDHLGIDQDNSCCNVFVFGKQRHPRFSDRALQRMREELARIDIEELWRNRRR